MSSRCVVCGREIEAGETVAVVEKGKIDAKTGEFSAKSTWGMAHFAPCFERSFDSPKMVMERLKKLSKAKPQPAEVK